MRRSAGSKLSIITVVLVLAGAACRPGGPAPAVTVEDATDITATATAPPAVMSNVPTSRAAPVLTAPPLRATATPEHTSPTPAPTSCADPYLTPPPVSATAEPADTSTPAPDETEATPTPVRIPHAEVVPTFAVTAASAPVDDAALEQRIRDRLGDAAGDYGIVIKDLGDGRGVAINAGQVFYAASLFKLEVMYDIFEQRDAGLLSFDERYVATDYYSGFDLGPHVVTPCATVSIGDALAAMMSVSDNVAAVMLQDRAGSGHINDAMAALGLADTRLTEDQSLPATAGDMALLVEAIARGQGVSAESSREMMALMETEQLGDRIPRELPDGTIVAHKTGNYTDATHDAGIVYGKRSTYVMVLMSDLGFDSDASLVEADIAKIAWDYFEGSGSP